MAIIHFMFEKKSFILYAAVVKTKYSFESAFFWTSKKFYDDTIIFAAAA